MTPILISMIRLRIHGWWVCFLSDETVEMLAKCWFYCVTLKIDYEKIMSELSALCFLLEGKKQLHSGNSLKPIRAQRSLSLRKPNDSNNQPMGNK